MNRFSLRQLYLYGICIITLLMVMFGVIQLAQHIVSLVIANPSASPSPQASPAVYEKQGMINSIVQIVVALPVYLYHWRQTRRTE